MIFLTVFYVRVLILSTVACGHRCPGENRSTAKTEYILRNAHVTCGLDLRVKEVFSTTTPLGIPKTAYMIESMGTAAAIQRMIDAEQDTDVDLHHKATMNGLCLVDFGNDGAIFVSIPRIPPRQHDSSFHSKLATLAKIAFEKYFLHKIESGDTDPYYEKYMLKLIGVERTKFE